MTIKCLIIDDEPLARELLKSFVSQISSLQLVAQCDSAILAFKVLQAHQIDLIFLDIQLPGINGLDFLKGLADPPRVIITTAYRDYALEGYELNIVDYLLKPFSFDRLFKAVIKVQAALARNDKSNRKTDFIYLRVDKKVIRIKLSDILYIESMKDNIRVRTLENEIIAYQKISYMEENLPGNQFIRVHRSFIVSIPNIEAYSATNVEMQGFSVPIGRNYKNLVLPYLNQRIL